MGKSDFKLINEANEIQELQRIKLATKIVTTKILNLNGNSVSPTQMAGLICMLDTLSWILRIDTGIPSAIDGLLEGAILSGEEHLYN